MCCPNNSILYIYFRKKICGKSGTGPPRKINVTGEVIITEQNFDDILFSFFLGPR